MISIMSNYEKLKSALKGEWEWVGEDRWNDAYKCSKCGKLHTDDSAFCPSCGSPMTNSAVKILVTTLSPYLPSLPTHGETGQQLKCTGCFYLDEDCAPCAHCIRAADYADYYRPVQEGDE